MAVAVFQATPLRHRLGQYISLLRFGWQTVIAPWPPFAIFLAITGVIGGVTPPVMVATISSLIEGATVAVSSGQPGDTSVLDALRPVFPWALALFGLRVISWIAYSDTVQNYLAVQLRERVMERFDRLLLTKAYSVPLSRFETTELYDVMVRAHRSMHAWNVTHQLPHLQRLVSTILGGVGVLWVLGVVHLGIPSLLLVGSVVVIWRHMRSEQQYVDVRQSQAPLWRRQYYWRNLLTERDAASEVRLFGLSDHLVKSWRTVTDQLIGELSRLRRGEIPRALPSEAINLALVGIVMGSLVVAGSNGALDVAAFVALFYVTNQYVTHLNDMGWRLRDLRQFFVELGYAAEYLEIEEESLERGVAPPSRLQDGIRFESVSFTYPGSETPALDAVDLDIKAGESIALVGENGAGKTTLTKLLLGLYRPTSGRIMVDGTDLNDIALTSWRKQIGAAFQDYMKYALTARENIGLGDISRVDDNEAIEQAARLSSAQAVIDGLPSGFDTMLGKEFAGGQEISEGQWQKLAIARVYLRDTDILVLDEPASALDALAELEVYRRFLVLSEGKTVLLISHRLGSARLADRIVFLHRGVIVEQGTHEELIASGGPYAELYRMQAEWYR